MVPASHLEGADEFVDFRAQLHRRGEREVLHCERCVSGKVDLQL